MIGTNGTRMARCRYAIVTAAIAGVLLCGGRASAWAATSSGTPAAQVGENPSASSSSRATTPAAPTSSSVADRYAQRETSARNLESFKGGDVVIVGSGGVIIVLLLIIIILSL